MFSCMSLLRYFMIFIGTSSTHPPNHIKVFIISNNKPRFIGCFIWQKSVRYKMKKKVVVKSLCGETTPPLSPPQPVHPYPAASFL